MKVFDSITAAIVTLMTLGGVLHVHAEEFIPHPIRVTAEKCFVEAPPEVLSLVLPNTRLDMIDYFKAGMERASENAAGGECKLLSLDPESVTLTGGTGIKYQIFVVEGKKKPYIGVIETLATPVEESMVRFYTSDWTPVDPAKKGFFTAPLLKDWTAGDRKLTDETRETLPFILTGYAYDPATLTLTATNNMSEYYHPTDTPEVVGKLKHMITYRWDAGREAFVMEKNKK